MSQKRLLHDGEGTARTLKQRLQERTTCDEVLVKVWHLSRSLPWTDGVGKTFVDSADRWWISPQVQDRLRRSVVGSVGEAFDIIGHVAGMSTSLYVGRTANASHAFLRAPCRFARR